jgi:hypothetical protein
VTAWNAARERQVFWACTAFAMVLHGVLLFGTPGLHGGADLVPHLWLIERMAEAPALRNVYAPAYHVIGGLLTPLVGLELYVELFALASALALILAFRYLVRCLALPGEGASLFALFPYNLSLSWCLPKVEEAGYALAFVGLGLLSRRRYTAAAVLLGLTFYFHTAAALFLGGAGGVLALARRDGRALVALAIGTLAVAPLVAAHLAAGCDLAQALLLSRNDYLRTTSAWSSLGMIDVIAVLASPIALALAGLGARELWRRDRAVALMCAVLTVLYLNELWLAPFETRTSLDLYRGLSTLAVPVCLAAGVSVAARPRAAAWLLGVCALFALGSTLFVAPRSCYVYETRLSELEGMRVDRCTFRWGGPHLPRHRPPLVRPFD